MCQAICAICWRRAQLRLLRASYSSDNARLLYAEGLLASDQGRVPLAIDRFRQALAADPHLTEARQGLGIALIQAERWPEAVEVLAPLAKDQPESFTVAYFHALALENAERGLRRNRKFAAP